MDKLQVPGQLASGFIDTSETDEAAILRALRVEFVKDSECRVEHDKFNPYDSGRGTTVFSLEARNAEGVETAELSAAYRRTDGLHNAQLDDAVEQIEDESLRRKISKLIVLANAENGRAFAEQRKECMRLHHKASRIIKGISRRGGRYAIDVKNKAFARRIGA